MQDFRNLKVWQKAHELTLLVYKLTLDFPKEELFGLRNSLRRTSVEIPAHVAEGTGKDSDAEFSRSIGAALSFANRLDYHVLLAFDLKMFSNSESEILNIEIIEVKKMSNGFKRRLR